MVFRFDSLLCCIFLTYKQFLVWQEVRWIVEHGRLHGVTVSNVL